MDRVPLAVLSLLLAAPAAAAGILHVPQDYPTIQEALDAAVGGDEVVVAPGRYPENVVLATNGVVLRGSTKAVIDGGYAGPCVTVTADVVALSKLRLVNGSVGLQATGTLVIAADLLVEACAGAGLEITGDSAIIGRCEVTGCGGDGVRLAAQTLENEAIVGLNRVRGCGGHGLALSGPATFYVVGNRCAGNAGDGLRLEVSDPGVSDPSRLWQNTCDDNGGRGLFVETTGGAALDRNTARRNASHGVHAKGVGVGVDRCKAFDNRAAGVVLEALGGSTANRNVCKGNGREGLLVSLAEGGFGQNGATHNVLLANGRDGLRVTGGSVMLLDNVSRSNLGDGYDVEAEVGYCGLYRNTALRNGHEGLDNGSPSGVLGDGNVLRLNGGLDLAGAGAGGGVLTLEGVSTWLTGGPDAEQSLDL